MRARAGNPPVSNFGWEAPTFLFWQVAEVQTAFAHLADFSLNTNDWKVFGYLVGRGGLWISVITALWSMYDYFRYFLVENKKRQSVKDAVFNESKTVEAVSNK